MQKVINMDKNKKCKNKYINNMLCSLYEAENFLCNYSKFSDIITLIKIANKQQKKRKH